MVDEARSAECVEGIGLLQTAVGESLIAKAVAFLEEAASARSRSAPWWRARGPTACAPSARRAGKRSWNSGMLVRSGCFTGQRQQQDVDLAFEQLLGQRLRLRFAHMQLELGIGVAKQRQQRRQQVGRDRRGSRQAAACLTARGWHAARRRPDRGCRRECGRSGGRFPGPWA